MNPHTHRQLASKEWIFTIKAENKPVQHKWKNNAIEWKIPSWKWAIKNFRKKSFTFTSWQMASNSKSSYGYSMANRCKWKWNECRNARVRISRWIRKNPPPRLAHIKNALKSKAQSVSSEKHMQPRSSSSSWIQVFCCFVYRCVVSCWSCFLLLL